MNAFKLSLTVLLLFFGTVSPSPCADASSSGAALQTYPMQALAPTAAAILGVPAPKQAEAPPIDSIVNDLRGAKKVAILGIDAFGAAIWNKMRDKTPYLNSLATKTNQAQLRSVLPSVTCVNFGCMITGGSQKTTGIKTFDSELACEDLCSVLRAHGMKSGGFGIKDWTGDRLLGRYADFRVKEKTNDQDVLAGLMEIVDEKKPEFVIVQYGKTDDVFHAQGPFSTQAAEACAGADAWLQKIVPWLRARGYAIIITADHGQHDVPRADGTTGGAHGTASDLDCLVPLVWLPSVEGAKEPPKP
ncbi:MAG TPA: alkaline phosphatase family protein [Candidatus Anammoximicrobium sp.]|nr:alkaline phosphatase family protein [Candidatus Anammoximicrobium sp.]